MDCGFQWVKMIFIPILHLTEEARAEIVEMLTQQGLAEITSTSSGEQIAYLLVERAQLLERLEEKHHTSGPNSPETEDGRSSETELKQILERVCNI